MKFKVETMKSQLHIAYNLKFQKIQKNNNESSLCKCMQLVRFWIVGSFVWPTDARFKIFD